MAQLNPKFKFVLFVLGGTGVFFAAKTALPYLAPAGNKPGNISGLMSSGSATPTNSDGTNKCIEVGVVTWGGYAGGQYWNNGFKDNPDSKFRKDGICVNFSVMDDFAASRAAFKAGKMDAMWVTIDSFPTEAGSFGEPVKFLFQADWSRGGDAIVSKEGINAVGDLAGKKIAVAEATPSHTFLLWMLDMAGLSFMDVNIVKVSSAIDAAAAFKAGKVDAAVVWSPDDSACVSSVAGSKILVNTKQASNIIADGFMVKESTFNKRKDELKKFVEGWLKGAAEVNSSEEAKTKAANILSAGFTGVDVAFCKSAINNTRLATYSDNLDFFGLNSSYTGVTGKSIYEKMSTVYGKLNLANNPPNWNSIVDSSFIQSLNVEKGQQEKKVTFTAPTKADTTANAIASKPVKVSFASGTSELDDNAKSVIDFMFVEQVKAFPGSRIRIEGNTDSNGNAVANKKLSEARAKSVVDYLVTQHGMDRNRFIAIGNGSDKPVCSDATTICLAKNRRTDFQILGN